MSEFVIAGRRVIGTDLFDAVRRMSEVSDFLIEGERVDVAADPWAEEDAYWEELEGDDEA